MNRKWSMVSMPSWHAHEGSVTYTKRFRYKLSGKWPVLSCVMVATLCLRIFERPSRCFLGWCSCPSCFFSLLLKDLVCSVFHTLSVAMKAAALGLSVKVFGRGCFPSELAILSALFPVITSWPGHHRMAMRIWEKLTCRDLRILKVSFWLLRDETKDELDCRSFTTPWLLRNMVVLLVISVACSRVIISPSRTPRYSAC